MVGVDETLEMVLSKEIKPIISKKLYEEKAKENMPRVHVETG